VVKISQSSYPCIHEPTARLINNQLGHHKHHDGQLVLYKALNQLKRTSLLFYFCKFLLFTHEFFSYKYEHNLSNKFNRFHVFFIENTVIINY